MVPIGGIQKLSLVDYPGKTSAAFFTIGCNMRCGYCHNAELVLPERYAEALDEAYIWKFLEQRRGLLDGIVVSGGEPTMHDALPTFIARLKQLGYLVKLDSNGTRPDMLQQLIDDGLVDYIAMDIKAPLAKYSEVAARPIDTAAIQRSIDLIQSSGLEHEFRTTVVKYQLSPRDIESIGQLVAGSPRFALQKFVAGKTLSPRFRRLTTYTDEEFEILREVMLRYVDTCVVH